MQVHEGINMKRESRREMRRVGGRDVRRARGREVLISPDPFVD